MNFDHDFTPLILRRFIRLAKLNYTVLFPQGDGDRLHEAVHEPRDLHPLQEARGRGGTTLQVN